MAPRNDDATAWIEGRLDGDTYFAWARVRAAMTVRLEMRSRMQHGYVGHDTWSPEMRDWISGRMGGAAFFAHAAARAEQLAVIPRGRRTHRRTQRVFGPPRNRLHALAIAEVAAHWAQHPEAERAAVTIPPRVGGAPRARHRTHGLS